MAWSDPQLPRLGRRRRPFAYPAPAGRGAAKARRDAFAPVRARPVTGTSGVEIVLPPHVEVMLLDVPREKVEQLKLAIERLGRLAGLEIVDAGEITVDDARPNATGVRLHRRGKNGRPDDLVDLVMDTESSSDAASPRQSPADDPKRTALFGAENQAATLGDELVAEARQLPEARAAVLVVFHHAWRDVLASLLGDYETGVLLDRWIDGPDVETPGGRAITLEFLLRDEAPNE